MVWRRGVCLYYCDVERNCLRANGDEPAGDWVTSNDSVHDVLVNRKSNALLVFILFSPKKTLCPSSVVVSPKFFHLISQSPKMFHLYLSNSCVSFWSFPAALSVFVLHVPMVMLSLPWISDDAPVASLTSPYWCTAIRYGMAACFHHMVSQGQG